MTLDLIEPMSTSRTKHEVIKELADLLDVDGRAVTSGGLEEAIWRREESYSTGFGFGLHCLIANPEQVKPTRSPSSACASRLIGVPATVHPCGWSCCWRCGWRRRVASICAFFRNCHGWS